MRMPDTQQPTPVSAGADLARDVTLRLERWYEQRGLDLPAEAQAGFIEMAMEAVSRAPERPRDAVLDELIGELDGQLAAIQAEGGRDTAAQPPRRGWRRWLGLGR